MARDGAPTRRRILEAATRLLRTRGIDAFSIEAVARGAGVAKGLVIYHFGSRAELLRECGAAVQADRGERLRRARATDPGVRGIDACWEELRRQTADGTTRAWLGLVAAGAAPPPGDPDPDAVAGAGVLDGCALALAAGVAEASVREAHDALWLALLEVLEEPE
jgi:AcrR family transcriptional regulator